MDRVDESEDSKAIALRAGYAEAYYNRGLAFRALGRSTQATADFVTASQLNPRLPPP